MIIVGDWAPNQKAGRVLIEKANILANLEGPILSANHNLQPVAKAGPNLCSPSLPDNNHRFIFSLANNHIMDYGEKGFEAAISLLKTRNFLTVGAGKNITKARLPTFIEEDGVRIGIIACCEAQFGIARDNYVGVAEIGPWIYSQIRCLKQEADAVVVSVHAGIEDSPWPSPRIQELYRSLIDAGVAIVHGHHAHIPQGFELYNGGLIFYGMGNFLVDPDKWSKSPNTLWSIGADIDFSVNPLSWKLLTFEVGREDENSVSVRQSNVEERWKHDDYIAVCNSPLENPSLLNGLWHETALRTYFHYKARYMNFPLGDKRSLSRLERAHSLKSAFKKVFNSVIGFEQEKLPSQWNYLLWHVMFSCKSHRDSLATALGILGGELEDLRNEQTSSLADKMMPWSVGVVPL